MEEKYEKNRIKEEINDLYLKVSPMVFNERYNISSGINELKKASLYRQFMQDEVNNDFYINKYFGGAGNRTVLSILKMYSKLEAMGLHNFEQEFAHDVCLTIGATSAIVFVFDFYAYKYVESECCFLFLGQNYDLFYQCVNRYHFKFVNLFNNKKNQIMPDARTVIRYVSENSIDVLILTQPANPSGELYTEVEMKNIMLTCKKSHTDIVLDICQMDVLNPKGKYVNVHKIAYECDYLDHVIIINSLSKTRSIPGARLGYVEANHEIISYITKQNTFYYFNSSSIFQIPCIFDFIMRSCYEFSAEFDLILSVYRHIFLANCYELETKDYVLQHLNRQNFKKLYKEFAKEINNNWNQVKENYNLCTEILENHILEQTSMDGGFNFSLKFKVADTLQQDQFIKLLLKQTGLFIGGELFYSNEYNPYNYYVRLSVAVDPNIMESNLHKLNKFFNSI